MTLRQSLAVAIAVAVVLLLNSVYVIDQRALGILFRFGEIRHAPLAPGLHFKLPFAESVVKLDRRLRDDGHSVRVPASDQNALEVEYYVRWRIADPVAYYRATGGQDLVASDRLLTLVDRSLRDALATRSAAQVVADSGAALPAQLRRDAQTKTAELGIEVADVRIEHVGLGKEVAEAYYERMRAERRRIAEQLRAQGAEEAETLRAEADRQAQAALDDAYRKAEALRGEGDAKAAEIYAAAYGQDPDFFAFYRSLQAYRDALKGQRDVLVIEPKGEFFKYFRDSGGGK
jgi:membrane protease subunit HflC